ncbi:type I restriction endonuclease subunit S, partial [Helicobacter pylori]
ILYSLFFILTRMLVSVSKSHRKGLENYGKDIKT